MSDQLKVGPVSRINKAPLVIDFTPDNEDGIAIDIGKCPASGSNGASIKVGDFIIGQDVFNNGADNFQIADGTGTLIFSAEPGADKVTETQALAAYAAASAVATLYHAEIDKQGLGALANIDGTTPTDAVAWGRANDLQALFLAHMAGEAALLSLGEHKAADTAAIATLEAVPAATSTASLCTLAIAIGAAMIDHGDQAGVHFHDDSTLAGYTPTSDLLAGNATKANAVTELDALLAAMLVHVSNGAYEIPA